MFRSPREKLGRLYDSNDKLVEEITWVVNSKEEAERVVEFMKGQDKRMVRAIKGGQGKDRVEVEMPEFVEPKKETKVTKKGKKKSKK